MNEYTALAKVYDCLAYDYDYQAWGDWYCRLFDRLNVPAGGYVLDAACGTGNMTIELLKAGYEVVGMDKSGDMLRVAFQRLQRLGFRPPLVKRDMQDIALHRKADAIVCACDGVNYLTQTEHVRRFFQSAYANLKEGGVFIFDISSAYKLQQVLGNELYAQEEDDLAYIWKNTYDPDRNLCCMDISLFIKEEEGELFRRACETHVQRAYRDDELCSELKDVGFELVGIYGGLNDVPVDEKALRLHFVAYKPGGKESMVMG